MMKRFTFSLVLLALAFAGSAEARQKIYGWCQDGNVSVVIPGTQGSGTQKFQRSYSACTVTVYLPGTTTLATLFSNQTGTAKANPFTAAASGQWFAYVDIPDVDVRFSGGGITAPFTIGNYVQQADTATVMSFGARCDGVTDDSTAFSTASAYFATLGGDLTIPAGRTCVINSNLVLSAKMGLLFDTGSAISVSAGKTVTINGGWKAGYSQVFKGTGTVNFGRAPQDLDPVWWGAVYDNSTDDSAAIQAAINAAGDTVSVFRTGGTVHVTGLSAIASTLLIQHKAVTLDCGGVGAFVSTSPPSNGLRWTGVANVPMIQVKDNVGISTIQNCRIYGNTTNVPRSAISYTKVGGFGTGNQVLRNLYIGAFTGDTGYTGTGFQDIIYVGDNYDGGTQGNNDTFYFENLFLSGCSGSGIRQGSIQNVNSTVQTAQIKSCAYGMRIVASMAARSVFFSGNTTADIYLPGTDSYAGGTAPRFHGIDIESENGSRLLLVDNNSLVDINGGYAQLDTGTLNVDGKVVYAEGSGHGYIRFSNYAFSAGGSPPANWYFSVRSPVGNVNYKKLELDNIRVVGLSNPQFNVNTRGPQDSRWVCYSESWLSTTPSLPKWCNFITGNNGTTDATRYDIPNTTLRVGLPRNYSDETLNQGTFEVSSSTAKATLTGASTTLTGLIPANVLVLGVVGRVLDAITCAGCTNYLIGTVASPSKWANESLGGGRGAGNQEITMADWDLTKVGSNPPGTPYYVQTAEDVVITPNAGTFSTGTITITATYIRLNTPILY